MADKDPNWPSEDEDFDAVHTGGPIATDTDASEPAADTPKPGTSVKIISADDEDEPESASPAVDSAPAEDSQPAAEESSADSEEPGLSSESGDMSSEEPSSEPEAPVSESPEAASDAPAETEPETSADETSSASDSEWPTEASTAPAATPEVQTADAEPSEEAAPMTESETPSTTETAEVEPMPAMAAVMPQTGSVATTSKDSKMGSKGLLRLVAEVLLVVALVGLAAYAMQLKSQKTTLAGELAQANANPQLLVQKQTDAVIHQVSLLMQLPKDETPTVANVSDAVAAKKQSAFFNNAQNGDKVLMYVKTGEAILYRPSTNKIVLVAPLTFANSTSTAPATTSTTKKP